MVGMVLIGELTRSISRLLSTSKLLSILKNIFLNPTIFTIMDIHRIFLLYYARSIARNTTKYGQAFFGCSEHSKLGLSIQEDKYWCATFLHPQLFRIQVV